MARLPIALPLVLLLPALLSAAHPARPATPADDDTYTSETHGFSVKRPDASWTFGETRGESDGLLTVSIQPASSGGVVAVKVLAKPQVEKRTARAVRDELLKDVRAKPEYVEVARGNFEVAGRKAPGMRVLLKSGGKVYRVELCYFVEDGLTYSLQCHAPKEEFEKYAPVFRKTWDTFQRTEIPPELRAEQRLLALAGKCGTEIEWLDDWEEASRRAQKEKKLVLVYARLLSAFSLSDSTMTGAFMDPFIVDIVKERFVALRYEKGMEAPFVSQDSYGMGPASFGTSLLLATPKGEIVGDTASLAAPSLHEFLVEHLGRHPEASGAAAPRRPKGAARAGWHLSRGEYEEAAGLLEAPATAEEHRLRASLLHRLRRGEEALAALEACRMAHGDEAPPELAVEESVVLCRLGRAEEAMKKLTAFIEGHAGSPAAPEALFWIGALRLRFGAKKSAETTWRRLIDAHEDSRWAWRAAGLLKSTGFTLGLGPRLEWPPEEILAVCRAVAAERLKRSKVDQAERDALAYLLERQRPDGSWISPAEVGLTLDRGPHPFTTAITAICARSLLERREAPGAEEAMRRAVDYLVAARTKAKALESQATFMDYSMYSHAYTLWLFADGIRAGVLEREEIAPVMEELVAALRAQQRENGGWSYYLTTDLANADTPAKQSISFVTALPLLALLETRDAGVEVPDEVIRRAADCLQDMYNPNGTYEYMLHVGQGKGARGTTRPGAAGRGPLCSLALLRAGRVDRARLRESLDIFLEHRQTYAVLHRKSLMHTGLDGQGSHYLLFDYAFAAAAVEALPDGERARYRAALLDQILGARSEDGSFIDNPINGPHYATGKALLAFRSLAIRL